MCLILILKLWTKTLFTCIPVHLKLLRDRTFVIAYGRESRARLWASGRDPINRHPLHKPETVHCNHWPVTLMGCPSLY